MHHPLEDVSLSSSSPSPSPAEPKPRPKPPAPARNNKALRRLAECCVCLKVRQANVIYECPSGHNVCELCFDRMREKKCPLGDCQVAYDSPPRRNRTAEALVVSQAHLFPVFDCRHGCGHRGNLGDLQEHERHCVERPEVCQYASCGKVMKAAQVSEHNAEFHVPCRYCPRGCDVVGPKADVASHEEGCLRRSVPCPVCQCSQWVQVRHVMTHLAAKHSTTSCVPAREQGSFVTEFEWLDGKSRDVDFHRVGEAALKHDGVSFFVHVFRLGGDLVAWVSALASPRQAKLLSARISVAGNNRYHAAAGQPFGVDRRMSAAAASLSTDDDDAVLFLSERQVRQCLVNRREAIRDGGGGQGRVKQMVLLSVKFGEGDDAAATGGTGAAAAKKKAEMQDCVLV